MHAEFLEPASIGFEDFERHPARVTHALASRRNPAGNGEDEAAQRVDDLLLLIGDERQSEMLLQVLDRHPRIGDEAETGIGPDQRLVLYVVFVGNLAHHFLDQILDGNEPVGAAILVDHQRQMESRRLHFEQKIEHRHRRRHVKRLAGDIHGDDRALEIDLAEIEPRRAAGFALRRDPRHQIADMDHAARIVERLMVDRQTRMLGLAEDVHQLADGYRVVDRDDVGARQHDVLDGELAEAQDTAQHAALLRAQRFALAAGERVLDQLAQIGLFAETEGLQHALEPGHLLVGLAGFLGRQVFLGSRAVVGSRGVAHGDAPAWRA